MVGEQRRLENKYVGENCRERKQIEREKEEKCLYSDAGRRSRERGVRQNEGDESKLACRIYRRERENRGWKGENMGQELRKTSKCFNLYFREQN